MSFALAPPPGLVTVTRIEVQL